MPEHDEGGVDRRSEVEVEALQEGLQDRPARPSEVGGLRGQVRREVRVVHGEEAEQHPVLGVADGHGPVPGGRSPDGVVDRSAAASCSARSVIAVVST